LVPVGINVNCKDGNIRNHAPGTKKSNQPVFISYHVQKLGKGIKAEPEKINANKNDAG
jgi:hypothetical protein